MKSLVKMAIATIFLVAMGLTVQAEQKTITLGTMAWEDILPITGATKVTLEKKGYEVEVSEFSEFGIAFAALARGDIDVMVAELDFIASDYWKRNKRQLEKISIASHGVYQAFAVPKYVDINSIEDLNANAEIFDNKIIGIEPGSGLMREATQAVKDYDLNLQLIEGSTAGMTAALKSAVERKQPIVVTLWDPTWMYSKFDMKFLNDPKQIFALPQSYNIIAQKGFSEKNPEAREILSGIFLPLADIRAINVAVANGKTMEQAIEEWIQTHDALIERWADVKKY